MSERGQVALLAVEIALGTAMPLRPSVPSLAQVALDALAEAGYTLVPPCCSCSVSGVPHPRTAICGDDDPREHILTALQRLTTLMQAMDATIQAVYDLDPAAHATTSRDYGRGFAEALRLAREAIDTRMRTATVSLGEAEAQAGRKPMTLLPWQHDLVDRLLERDSETGEFVCQPSATDPRPRP